MNKPDPFLYSYKCPKCAVIGKHKHIKSWKIKGKGDIETRIDIYRCFECRRKWRRGVNLNLGGVPA